MSRTIEMAYQTLVNSAVFIRTIEPSALAAFFFLFATRYFATMNERPHNISLTNTLCRGSLSYFEPTKTPRKHVTTWENLNLLFSNLSSKSRETSGR